MSCVLYIVYIEVCMGVVCMCVIYIYVRVVLCMCCDVLCVLCVLGDLMC